ncbi:MAG: hypothetical protein KDA20_02200 [Phycisphaerales bacterium]|nr:hypothetical protein [Phycisphaerales bacterium]
MTTDQLRQALKELDGKRDAAFSFGGAANACTVTNAMLVPDEADHLIKLTDGKHVFIIDAERVDWVRIG